MAWETTHMDPERLSDALHCARRAVGSVSETLREHFGKSDHKTKSNSHDYVTQWDTWAEEQIVKALTGFSADFGIVAEEGSTRPGRDIYWTVDPIDGTFHFVEGTPKCTTMVALIDNGVPILSVINDFVHDDMYTAVIGQGAFQNTGQRLMMKQHVIGESTLEFYTNLKNGEAVQSAINDAGIQTVHNAASGFAAICAATGRTDGVTFLGTDAPNEWDIAPLIVLIREAGGDISNLVEKDYRIGEKYMLAAHPETAKKVRVILRDSGIPD